MSSATPPHDSHGPDLYSGRDLQSASAPVVDRFRLRQVLFGAVVVIGLRFATEILTAVGYLAVAVMQPSWGFSGSAVIQVVVVFAMAVLFSLGAGVSGVFVLPLTASVGVWKLLGRVAVGGMIGTVAMVLGSVLLTLASARSGYMLPSLLSSGLITPITIGLINTALFALGVMVARSLPSAELGKAPQ